MGLQFSYLGTIGIIVFYKNVYVVLENIKITSKKLKYEIKKKDMLNNVDIRYMLC